MTSNKVSHVLAFDLGGTKIASGIVTFAADGTLMGDVQQVVTIPTNASEGGPAVLERLTALAAQRLSQLDADGASGEVSAIGLGSAGVVDSEHGVIVSSTDLIPDWTGQRLADALHGLRTLPVAVVNDVVAHGLGEAHYGAGIGYSRVLSVGVGTGIGGALIVDGQPVFGAHDVAGHIGHITHALGRGVPCSCGTICGHIEPVASGTGLATLYNLRRAAVDSGLRAISNGRKVCELAEAGEPLAISVLTDSARALGEALGGAANLIDPDIIVISGSVTKAGPLWWTALRAGFNDSAMGLTRTIPLAEGMLGGNAPLIGAAVAALQTPCI